MNHDELGRSLKAQYLDVSARLSNIWQEIMSEMEPHQALLDTDEGIDQFTEIEMKLHEEKGYTELQRESFTLRAALLLWLQTHIETNENFASVKELYKDVWANLKFHPVQREKLIEYALLIIS